MSAEAQPISNEQFEVALETLPLGNLYAKALEIRNSNAHLQRSNAELKLFSEEAGGDRDCDEAIEENENVIGRNNQRLDILKLEIEKRGASWLEAEDAAKLQEMLNNEPRENQNGDVTEAPEETESSHINGEELPVRGQQTQPGGRLTDEQLRERLLAQMEDDEEEGVHL